MSNPIPLIYSEASARQGSLELRELMGLPEEQRDLAWLRRMLQYAIRLEFTTIPPYLFAMWSVIDDGDPVVGLISDIVQQEMLHLGIVCNLLNAVDGGKADVSSRTVVPSYPTPLPGGVHPGLVVGLEAISKDLVGGVFMEIEKPEFGPVVWFRGETYPTIGAFYTAIAGRVARLKPEEVPGERQIKLAKPFKLNPIGSVQDALDGIRLIKEQGEGTSASPLFGPSAADVAHYYSFGEIYHEKQLKQESSGKWCYSGDPLPFPKPEGIYPVAPVPAAGCPESRAFNEVYGKMLRELQLAWDAGGGEGGGHLTTAMGLMTQLGPLAVALMQKEIPSGGGKRFGPTFQPV